MMTIVQIIIIIVIRIVIRIVIMAHAWILAHYSYARNGLICLLSCDGVTHLQKVSSHSQSSASMMKRFDVALQERLDQYTTIVSSRTMVICGVKDVR